jgi:hypothetical protein
VAEGREGLAQGLAVFQTALGFEHAVSAAEEVFLDLQDGDGVRGAEAPVDVPVKFFV